MTRCSAVADAPTPTSRWSSTGASATRALNLPAVGSLSLTLDGLSTRTEVRLRRRSPRDTLALNGAPADERADGARLAVPRPRARSAPASRERASVDSSNNFPDRGGAGLVGLGVRGARRWRRRARPGSTLDRRELSILARRGSGSAARSIFGGFVEMHRGERADGEDAFAEPIGRPTGTCGW